MVHLEITYQVFAKNRFIVPDEIFKVLDIYQQILARHDLAMTGYDVFKVKIQVADETV